MTSVDMTLAESDNILAKFMEWEQDPRHLFWYTKGIDKKFIKPYLSNKGYLYQEAFSTDVNWLMSVVDKIESLEEINLPYSYNYSIGNVNNGIEGNREDSIIVESVSLIIEREVLGKKCPKCPKRRLRYYQTIAYGKKENALTIRGRYNKSL